MTAKKPVKVCFISLNSYPLFAKKSLGYFGGAELQMSLIVKQLLKDKQFAVSLITGDYGQNRIVKKNRLIIFKCFDKQSHRLIELTRLFFWSLKTKQDVFVSRTANNLLYLLAIYCKLFNKKFVYMVAHDWDCQTDQYNKLTKVNRRLFLWGLKKADLIIAQTKQQQQALKENLGLNSILMLSVIPSVKPINKVKKDLVLWVGRADYWKRPMAFIKLAHALPKEKMVMICRKGLDAKLFKRIKTLAEKQKNIDFLPAVPIEEITHFFARAKIFVNTSTAEGFPNTFLQSGLARTPILSLTVNPDNYLTKHHCGFQTQNKNDLFIALAQKLLNNPKQLQKMGENHRHYIIKNHSLKNIKKISAALIK
jgi:glycosyltransferase involved in cell wall biosynthesis